MKPAELLLLLLAGWTLFGIIGVALRLGRHETRTAIRHFLWILGVWTVYLCLLLSLSFFQQARVVPMGSEQCFDEMCFAITGVQQVSGFLIKDDSHLLEVQVRVTNHGHGGRERESLLHLYLRDSQGRTWTPLQGVSGNRLTGSVAAGSSMISEPVFRVPGNASGLELIFTHGKRQPGLLVLGDPDSLLHRPTVVPLNPPAIAP